MAKHRRFNADRFVDKFQGQEQLLRNYVALFDGKVGPKPGALTVATFKGFLAEADGESMDDLFEGLYRVYDLSTEDGHEHIVAACRDLGYDADPKGKLPVECLGLKVRTENEEAFNFAYARNTLGHAERFSLYRGKKPKDIPDLADARRRLEAKLAETFKGDKSSDRVLVRPYQEGAYTHFVVYHEKRTKAELVFKGPRGKERVTPTILRPAQQDFISYDPKTGQVEIEARTEHEESILRTHFAACCLGAPEFFEGEEAATRFNLARIAEEGFSIPVDDGDAAAITELHVQLKQKRNPNFVIRSPDVLATLEENDFRNRLAGALVKRAVLKFTFPDDQRGKRVVLARKNQIQFKRATHDDDIFRYLRGAGLLVA